mmetsp:Transcript_71696/g.126223  ORF Transcript_71696/g.126223 Transcript_71696/m.126223 type:complete len:87 (-) Transcript_71696:266-526(-)
MTDCAKHRGCSACNSVEIWADKGAEGQDKAFRWAYTLWAIKSAKLKWDRERGSKGHFPGTPSLPGLSVWCYCSNTFHCLSPFAELI